MTKWSEAIRRQDKKRIEECGFKVGDKVWIYGEMSDLHGEFSLHQVTIAYIGVFRLNSDWDKGRVGIRISEDIAGIDPDAHFEDFFRTREEAAEAAHSRIAELHEHEIARLERELSRHRRILSKAKRRKCEMRPMERLAWRLLHLCSLGNRRTFVEWGDLSVPFLKSDRATALRVEMELVKKYGEDGKEYHKNDD